MGIAVLFFDIDHFKRVNDAFGHAAGDRVIVEVAKRIERTLRATDLLFRWGGEEFVVVMPHTDPEETKPIAERIRAAVSESAFLDGRGEGALRITVSIGVAATGNAREGTDSLLHQADRRCLAAKVAGRNQVMG